MVIRVGNPSTLVIVAQIFARPAMARYLVRSVFIVHGFVLTSDLAKMTETLLRIPRQRQITPKKSLEVKNQTRKLGLLMSKGDGILDSKISIPPLEKRQVLFIRGIDTELKWILDV